MSNVCYLGQIWRLRPLICRQSHTGFFYCKGGSTYYLTSPIFNSSLSQTGCFYCKGGSTMKVEVHIAHSLKCGKITWSIKSINFKLLFKQTCLNLWRIILFSFSGKRDSTITKKGNKGIVYVMSLTTQQRSLKKKKKENCGAFKFS